MRNKYIKSGLAGLGMLLLTGTTNFTNAQSFTEGFDDLASLDEWLVANLSASPSTTFGWGVGNSTNFPAQAGAANSYLSCNFQSTTSPTGATISNWLFTPSRVFNNGDVISFYTRKSGAATDFPDRLQVRMNQTGPNVNVGTTPTDVGEFTTLLLDINPTLTTGVYPTTWTQYTITISGLSSPVSGRIAFRYFVTDGGTNGTNSDYIGIDTYSYTSTLPAPANDNCAGATTITHGNTCVPTTGNVTGATMSTPATTCGTSTPNDDVWYKFVATATTAKITVDGSADFDAVFEVYSGATCVGMTSVACQDTSLEGDVEALTLNNLSVNQTYYVRVFDWYATAPATRDFTICVENPCVQTVLSAGGGTSFCSGGNVVLTSTGTGSFAWYNGTTLINGQTASTYTATTSGSYTAVNTNNGCVVTSNAITVTVNPAENATFSYPSYTLCSGGGTTTPTAVTAGGTYSSTTGLVINTSTGVIDIDGSNEGSYVVTYTTAGTCPGTSTHTVTITSAPDADFTYASAAYCSNGTDPSPVFAPGASGGAFSSSTGLTIDGGTGVIDLSASTDGTYTVTNTIAASGSCAASSSTFSVTVNAAVSPAFAAVDAVCSGSTIAALPATSTNNIDGTWAPAINNTATTTYTFTPDAGECATTAMLTITVNQLPTVGVNTAAICAGQSVTLTATGAATYNWSPSTGLSATTGASVTANPAATTTYTVIGESAEGCEASATTTVTVNQAPTVALGQLPTLCNYNAAVTLNQGTPAGGSYSGTGVTANSFSPSAAGNGTFPITYTFTDANGCSASATQNITVDACLSVDENVFGNLSVFPNPANSDVTVSFTNVMSSDVELSLLTNDGKVVSAKTVKANNTFSEKIDLSNLASGIYFIRLNTTSGSAIQKIVKQ